MGDELRLSEDLQLDSLSRVQLAAALEQRLGIAPESGLLEEVETLGQLRALISGEAEQAESEAAEDRISRAIPLESGLEHERLALDPALSRPDSSAVDARAEAADSHSEAAARVTPLAAGPAEAAPIRCVYPRWPWLRPFHWLRVAFVEAVERPLVGLLANPRVTAPPAEEPASSGPGSPEPGSPELGSPEPMLIVANHVTAFDGPLVQYALPGAVRRRLAVAMSGEMLEDFRHARNPERAAGQSGFYLPGPAIYFLLTALFNVFPLPRRQNFQQSFAHAGAAMDHGYSVLVFPEGTRSAAGTLARFRGGIGLLAKQSGAAVLPVALVGLGELKAGNRRWFRSGKIEVRVGPADPLWPEESEAAITARLHAEVERLLGG